VLQNDVFGGEDQGVFGAAVAGQEDAEVLMRTCGGRRGRRSRAPPGRR